MNLKKRSTLKRFVPSIDKIATLVLWSVTIVAGLIAVYLIYWSMTYDVLDTEYHGADIPRLVLSEGSKFEILSTGPVTAVAGSDEHFIIDNGDGIAYSASKSDNLPPGWRSEDYYISEDISLSKGIWLVRDADITIDLIGNPGTELIILGNQPNIIVRLLLTVIFLLVTSLVWILVLVVILGFFRWIGVDLLD